MVRNYLLPLLPHSSWQKWPAMVNYIISILSCWLLREQIHFFLSHPCMPVNCRWFGWLARGEWKAAKEAGTPQYRTAHIVCLRFVSMGPEMTLAWPNNHFWKGQCFDYCSKCAASGQFAHDELHSAARRRTGRVVCVQEDSALCALRSQCFPLVFFPKWVLSHLSNLRLIKYL